MATDSFSKPYLNTATHSSGRLSASELVQAIVAPLASLKLTVVLLGLAILVVFVATLEQTRADVYDIKMRHFRSLFVAVPFQTFFVPAWFPGLQNIPGRFWMPSGFTILVLMIINLTAAHSMRFRIKARGKQLAFGTMVAAFAGLVTWAVIFNGQNADGFQAKPPISYQAMWILVQVGLLLITIASVIGAVVIDRKRRIERMMLWIAAVTVGAVLAVTVILGDSAFIGDSAMRILWQLAQATLAAIVAYVACVMLFHRKAGMVLLHLGVVGLMLNEIFVTVTNDEQRMTVTEGETTSVAVDIRHTEMAIVDTTSEEVDQITTVPGAMLESGQRITDPQLPFDIECVRYLPASDLDAAPGENLATKGIGQRVRAIEVPVTAGTDSEQVADFASAYVELFDKSSGDSLGTYLISQALAVSRADRVQVGEQTYRILLRFETEYKPYAVTLQDATRENYVGTDTPKYYGSQVTIDDIENGLKTSQTIFMNEPLRYANETFYQSGMDEAGMGRQLSVFQIVTNVGWMIPYVCCMFTVVGLVAQFGESLMTGLKRQYAKQQIPTAKLLKDEVEADPLTSGQRGSFLGRWWPALLVAGVFGLWAFSLFGGALRPREHDGMRLDLLARIPVTYEGRVQPLGSFAINTARQVSERESIRDSKDEKQAAIRWLADLAFDVENADQYRSFRITDPNVIDALELPKEFPRQPKRKKFYYTVEEIFESVPKLAALIPNPQKKNPKQWTQLESRLAKLGGFVRQLQGLQEMFGRQQAASDEWLFRIQQARGTLENSNIPLVIPQDKEETPWLSLPVAQDRQWLQQLAKELEASTTVELSRKIVEQDVIPRVREGMIRDELIRRLMIVPEFRDTMIERAQSDDPQVVMEMLKRDWDSLPAGMIESMSETVAPEIDRQLAEQSEQFAGRLETELEPLAADEQLMSFNVGDETGAFELLQKLRPAYKQGDAESFNSTLEEYLAAVESHPPIQYSGWKMTLERFYNSGMPFYSSMAMYVAVFLFAAISWIVLPQTLGRVAWLLLLTAMAIHLVGIVMRVAISGRPPVTNLYSSVLFVSLFEVGLLLIFELRTKLRIGLALAGISGFAALAWAYTMTISDGDTFTVMVAVLDTNFWLATHVVCISIGYAATFAAGLLGLAFIVAGLLTPVLAQKAVRRVFTNIIYGVLCFGLLTSFFGTVLGGLWGDDSWGRFWGWDPKENGALMIVLATALILHARWGGMVKERGVAALAVLANIVVLWSWKGVNAMGVGLHAYAASDDPTQAIIVLVGVGHLVIAGLALVPLQWWNSYAADPGTNP